MRERAAAPLLIEHARRKPGPSGACAEGAAAEPERAWSRSGVGEAGVMLSPEAERVLRYLVEVEELAEAVLADKRQVGGASAAQGPGPAVGPGGDRPREVRGPELAPAALAEFTRTEFTRSDGGGHKRGRLRRCGHSVAPHPFLQTYVLGEHPLCANGPLSILPVRFTVPFRSRTITPLGSLPDPLFQRAVLGIVPVKALEGRKGTGKRSGGLWLLWGGALGGTWTPGLGGLVDLTGNSGLVLLGVPAG